MKDIQFYSSQDVLLLQVWAPLCNMHLFALENAILNLIKRTYFDRPLHRDFKELLCFLGISVQLHPDEA